MITMYDSIQVSQIPPDATAAAGYVNGNWPTYEALKAKFPHAHLLSIAVNASADADVLDVEQGDATPPQAPGWIKRQFARQACRPVIYANASTMPAVVQALTAAGIVRSSVRLWSAHYTEAHICGPASCHFPGVPACDGTQWTPHALGRDLDQSLLLDDFFATAPEPPVTITSYKADGQISLAELASRRKVAVSTILRLTGSRGLYDAPLAHYLDDVFSGKIPPSSPVPAGTVLWVPA